MPLPTSPQKARSLAFLHLSGPRRGQLDNVTLPAFIGSEAGIHVQVPEIAPRHAFVFERDGEVVLQDGGSGSGTILNGEPVQEAVLRDGDMVELGSAGPRLRLRDGSAPPVPLVQALAWARPEGAPDRLSDVPGFARTLLHETAVRTTLPFRITMAGVALLGVLVLGWTQWQAHRVRLELGRLREALQVAEVERQRFYARIEDERQKAEADRSALATRVEELRSREEQLNRQLAEAASGEVHAVRQDLVRTRDRLASLETERAVGERIIREYGPGVCLVQGAYAFYDAEARPLRYRLDENARPMRDEDGSPALDPMGAGTVHLVEYFGTGFLVDRGGLVLTNRHVAEPWWNDEGADALLARGFKPRFTLFRAFFPREGEPFELEMVRPSDASDLALVRLDLRGRRIPALPLDRTGRGAVPGQPVVVVGYPAGLEALLAKTDGAVVKEVLVAAGRSSERITEVLARRGLIRPSTTQGHIGDVTKSDIVFDAPTTQGGSGGPVLNKEGLVVGVEYAVLSKFGGNSFGVPINYALDLMHGARKKTR
jgi:S1-C subfamily serine protease